MRIIKLSNDKNENSADLGNENLNNLMNNVLEDYDNNDSPGSLYQDMQENQSEYKELKNPDYNYLYDTDDQRFSEILSAKENAYTLDIKYKLKNEDFIIYRNILPEKIFVAKSTGNVIVVSNTERGYRSFIINNIQEIYQNY